MTTNDLDDFFKKKDRKSKKHSKNSSLLTNNEELLKHLVCATTATTLFKENKDIDFEDGDDEPVANSTHTRYPMNTAETGLATESIAPPATQDEIHHRNQSSTTKTHGHAKTSASGKLPVQDNTNTLGQPDEWEEFDDPNYENVRMKLSVGGPAIWEGNDDDDDFDDEANANVPDDTTDAADPNSTAPSRAHRRRDQQQQLKEKPAWNVDRLNQPDQQEPAPIVETRVEVVPAPVETAPSAVGAYRPPALRGVTGTIAASDRVSVGQRGSKKKEPNLASTEEFPTLGAAVNKK